MLIKELLNQIALVRKALDELEGYLTFRAEQRPQIFLLAGLLTYISALTPGLTSYVVYMKEAEAKEAELKKPGKDFSKN